VGSDNTGTGFVLDGEFMIIVILVGVATAALVGWLMIVLARFAPEVRVPRALALGRLAPSAYRAIRTAPARLQVSPEAPEPDPERESPEDVELAVRERLYGTRSGSR
jgi:hypothetical protein